MNELLAPAGDEQSAYAALDSGADAVYLGLPRFSARASAENFGTDAFRRVVRHAHLLGAKVYVALNTIVKDSETEDFFACAREAWNEGADALLIQDLFLGKRLKELWPDLVLHLSTQGGCCNALGAEVAREYGFSRVVLARETPLRDMAEISSVLATEAFVQGALCTAFSGQCYFSSFAGNNSGNRGRCKQPCRMKYSLDRAGYEAPAYALSLSDLCVGARVGEFAAAGVTSFKIEGRMRRPEYVAAAVKYYRALLDGLPAEEAFSRMKRAYNRGDYTRGLAFGQDASLLSRETQGHIGEDVGELLVRKGTYFCASGYPARRGDGFKILRGGKEVGGAAFSETAKGGFFLTSSAPLRTGDRVRVTTSVSAAEESLRPVRKRALRIRLRFVAGEPALAECGAFRFKGETPLAEARSAPLTEEELRACFLRTDGAPLLPAIEVETAGAFLPKSALNAFRREFYAALIGRLCPPRAPLPEVRTEETLQTGPRKERAAISESGGEGISIVKPRDYSALAEDPGAYLYLPPFFTAADEKLVAPRLRGYRGVYCEGYYGIALARKYGVELFAGAGFNLTNRFAVAGTVRAGAKRLVLSKELSRREQDALSVPGAFALKSGAVKVMDLCYCPFGRTCETCDRRGEYRLRDGAGRVFPMRRYRASDPWCRFEVYNCAPLAAAGGDAGELTDRSLTVGGAPTAGHADRSVQ